MAFCSFCGKQIEDGKIVCEEHSTTCASSSGQNYTSYVDSESRVDSVEKKNYSAPVWIIGIFSGIGMILSTVICDLFNNAIFDISTMTTNYFLASFGSLIFTIVFVAFCLLGFIVYNNKCISDNNKESTLPLLYIAFPCCGRIFVGSIPSFLLALHTAGYLRPVAYGILTNVENVVNCVLVAVVSSFLLYVVLKNSKEKEEQSRLQENFATIDQYSRTSVYSSENIRTNVISEKNKGVAALLCFFLGEFGIHRFYAGKIGTALLWMFTAGLFGIGWFVDFIMILVGSFKDSQGKYIK